MYVTPGQMIFKVVNPKNIWAEFDLHSEEASRIKVNDIVQIKLDGSEEETDAKINFVEPFYKERQSFTKMRVYLSNGSDKYRIGQLASASFIKRSNDSMWIPKSSQIDLGTRKIVFVKKEGMFQPVEIATGNQSENLVQVLKGIDAGASIAYNAQFMIDSESFIKIKK
jgi:Cu(I)/Ag(I) efflux system membrane fusion protein